MKLLRFTLVELLVVVAIVIILASLLMPGLKGVQEKAKDIRCKSNLKQLAIGMSSYSCDWNGYLPAPIAPGAASGLYLCWQVALFPYVCSKSLDGGWYATSSKFKGGVFDCPSSKEEPWDAATCYENYGMNYWIPSPHTWAEGCNAWPKLSQARNPCKVYLLADSNAWVVDSTRFQARHSGCRGNALFVDSHVDGMKRAVFSSSSDKY